MPVPATITDTTRPPFVTLNPKLLAILRCPECHNALEFREPDELRCTGCATRYAVQEGVPDLVKKSAAIVSNIDYRRHYVADSEVFDYFEERRGATAHSERRVREAVLSRLGHPGSILDVGCGSAWLAAAVKEQKPFLCSLDISTVNPGRAMSKYAWPDHVGVAADSFALPFLDNSFDAVVASEIIEHVPDPQAFIAELLRVVRPGGRLVISTPYKERLVMELCIHCNQQTPHNAHLHSFDEHKLLSYVKDLPVENADHFVFNNKLLVFARTWPVLQFLPFSLWKLVDRLSNLLVNKPMNIVLVIQKS